MKSYLLRIKKYIWIVVLSTLLASIVGYLVLRAIPATVQASSIIYVNAAAPGNSFSPSLSTNDSLGLASNYASVIPTRSVMQYVFNFDPEIKKRNYTVDDLLADVTAISSATAATVTITATTTNIDDSVLLANSVAKGFDGYIQVQRQQQLDTMRKDLQNQLAADQKQKDALTAQILSINNPNDPHVAIDTADRNALIQAMNTLQQQLVLLPPTASSGIVQTQMAVAQDAVPALKTSLILAVTAGLGLVVGVLLMLLVIFLDNRLYSEEQVEKAGLAYLGGLPNDRTIQENAAQATGEVVSNLTDICANLRLTGILPEQWQAPQGAVLLVTSPQVAEGKTTLATALAATMARGGATAVVIDGNLRQPSTHLAFGMSAVGIGLNGLLKGAGSVDDAVVRSNVPGVWLLPAGSPMSDATFLLRQQLPGILRLLRQRAGLVIIDGPALLSSSDAIELATMADGVALVVDARHERLPLLLRASELLRSLAHTPAGIIMNRLPRRRRNHYYATAYPRIPTSEGWLSLQAAHISNGDEASDGRKLQPGTALPAPMTRVIRPPTPHDVPSLLVPPGISSTSRGTLLDPPRNAPKMQQNPSMWRPAPSGIQNGKDE